MNVASDSRKKIVKKAINCPNLFGLRDHAQEQVENLECTQGSLISRSFQDKEWLYKAVVEF